MDLAASLEWLERNSEIECLIFFEIPLDHPGDLDRLKSAAQALGFEPDWDADRVTLRVFRPHPRLRDSF